MENKESQNIELTTNPQRIVLVDRTDTKERLEKLEKKFQKWSKIEKVAFAFSAISMASGFALFLEEGIKETIKVGLNAGVTITALGGLAAAFVLGGTGIVADTIANRRKNKIELDLQRVRETVALREEAKNNPNVVIEEKSEKQIKLERKLKKYDPEKIEAIGSLTSVVIGGAGAMGGLAVAGFVGAALTGAVTGGLCYLPFAISRKIAEARQNKLKKQLKETIKAEHPDFYRQELLAVMNDLSETAKQKMQLKEQEWAQVDVACKRAKECNSVEMIERLFNLAKNPKKDNMDNLNKLVLNNGKGIV